MKLVMVGCGGMGTYQAQKFRALGAQIIGAIDHNKEHRLRFCEEFNVGEHYEHLDMITCFAGRADALCCCLPDNAHFLCCQKAILLDMAVFCEKPLTSTLNEAVLLKGLPKSRPCMVNFSKRHIPALAAVQEALSQGMLGELQNVQISYLQSWYKTHVWGDPREVFRWKWRLLPSYNRDGCLSDLGSHLLDILFLLFETVNYERKLHEVTTPALVEYSALLSVGNNTPCILSCSYQHPEFDDALRLSIQGKSATLVMNTSFDRKQVALTSRDGISTKLEGKQPVSTYQKFFDSVQSGIPAAPNFEDGWRVQQILEEMR